MAEENQVTKEPQQITKEPQQITKEPQGDAQRVTTKNPKKIEAGKRLAERNRKKREVKKREEQAKLERILVNQYYRTGAVKGPVGPRTWCVLLALGVIGGLGYYIYRTKKGEKPQGKAQQNNPNHILRCNHRPTSLRWIKSFLYYKNGQEEYSK